MQYVDYGFAGVLTFMWFIGVLWALCAGILTWVYSYLEGECKTRTALYRKINWVLHRYVHVNEFTSVLLIFQSVTGFLMFMLSVITAMADVPMVMRVGSFFIMPFIVSMKVWPIIVVLLVFVGIVFGVKRVVDELTKD